MASEIISRAEARAQGLKWYYNGRPCHQGHVADRLLSNGSCRECCSAKAARKYETAAEKIKAAVARWRQANPEKVKAQIVRKEERRRANPEKARAYAARWSAANPEKKKAKDARYRAANRQKAKAASARWYEANREKALAFSSSWRKANQEKRKAIVKRWEKANPEKVRANEARWREANRDKRLVNEHKRRAQKKGSGGTHTASDLADILKAQGHRCAYCRVDLRRAKRHVDHIVPLVLGGSNGRANLQYLCRPCNLKKSARDPIDYAQSIGLLV